ncbi:hypothetical protein KR215_003435 [Drosophila sulfurigaster]|nr:hypothetical protein KR215_003435 [Drosophila sulfurigaster]
MDSPYLFVLLLIAWLFLLLYTCKRQMDFLARSRKISNVKRLQYEIRKNLKREQATFHTVRDLMHSSMLKSKEGVSELIAEDELQILQFQINAQLKKLEYALEFDVI